MESVNATRTGLGKLIFEVMYPIRQLLPDWPADTHESIYSDICTRGYYPGIGEEIALLADEVASDNLLTTQ